MELIDIGANRAATDLARETSSTRRRALVAGGERDHSRSRAWS
jgi:hypothetical protein